MATKQTLTSGYGTGLTDKQKKALSFVLEPGINDSQNASGSSGEDVEQVVGGGSGSPTSLSLKVTNSLITTAGNLNHVSLGDGVLGQVKTIIHITKLGGSNNNLVITPDNFANGSTITSDAANRSITLLYDGDNWQVIAGEITGSAEMVVG